MPRHDFAFPFQIDPATRRAAIAPYPAHVEQMIRQILLTTPGERVNLPEFGCGIRQALFAPFNEALAATTDLLIRQALGRWLAGQIEVERVIVPPPSVGEGESTLMIVIEYRLIETQQSLSTTVRILT